MRIAWMGVALLWMSLGFAGQDVPVAEPHTMGVFYYLDSDTEGLLALERQVGQVIARSRARGFGGAETAIWVLGAHSQVRLHSGKPGQFVFAVDPGTNPYTYVQFFRLDVRKDTREVLQTETAGGRRTDVLNRSQVPFRVMKHGVLSFKVVLQGPLTPGEYALSTPTSQVSYTFGVD
jgi:hypothetical protein